MNAIRPLSTTPVALFATMLGFALVPYISQAQGQLDRKKITVTKFKKNVENLDVLAKEMVAEARNEAKVQRGKTLELQAMSKHSELTSNLVKATLIGNPVIIRKASMDVQHNLKSLKLRRLKSNKNNDKIDRLINISVSSSDYLLSNLNEFNEANKIEPVNNKTSQPDPAKKKPGNPARAISNILKKTFN